MWHDLNTPDDFRDDWYGELTNQCGHTLLGVVVALLIVCAWREVTGEMPVRSWAFVAVFVPYAVGIEWLRQAWRAGDSWFDALMVAVGASAVLLPWREVYAVEGGTVVYLQHRYMLGIVAVWAVMLSLRVARRYRNRP